MWHIHSSICTMYNTLHIGSEFSFHLLIQNKYDTYYDLLHI